MPLKIESPRLIIREPNKTDLIFFQKWLADPALAKYVGGVRSPERILQTFDYILKNCFLKNMLEQRYMIRAFTHGLQ